MTRKDKENYSMNLEKIESLIKMVEESSLTQFNYKDGEIKISMSKLDNPPIIAGGPAPMMPPAAAPAAPAAEAPAAQEEDEALYITSPIVGTFYSAAAPDVPAFVRVGDQVKNGQTVCILEAMKLMNEIQCEYDCEIEAILVSNEQKVEYGQPLFRVKKL
jgi:acetyl-CoA carboxylase biotin carboxyl carrier protein